MKSLTVINYDVMFQNASKSFQTYLSDKDILYYNKQDSCCWFFLLIANISCYIQLSAQPCFNQDKIF